MPIVTPQYYTMLCEAVEEVAEDLKATKGYGYLSPEVKERLINSSISILKTMEVLVDVQEDK